MDCITTARGSPTTVTEMGPLRNFSSSLKVKSDGLLVFK